VDGARAAIVNVENSMVATTQIAQTTLRSVLGQHVLDELLSEREKINSILQGIIDSSKPAPWGFKVSIVEVKDIESRRACSARWPGGPRPRRATRQSHQRRRRVPGKRTAQGRRARDRGAPDRPPAPLLAETARTRASQSTTIVAV